MPVLSPFTVFHLDGERGLRGGERQLLYLACALRARGHHNIVVCRRGADLEAEARRLRLETMSLPFWSDFHPVSAAVLARAARRRPRAVLHAHTGRAAGVGALAARLGRLPWVAHRRVDFPLSGALSRRLKYDSAGKVIAISRAVADQLVKDGLRPDLISLVPSGLPVGAHERAWAGQDDSRFCPPSPSRRRAARRALAAELGLPEDARWVGNLAALVPHKDQRTLIAAAGKVLERRPRTVFVIGGEGPEEPALRAAVAAAGLEGRVALAGHRRDPAAFLAALDVFCLSSWGEGMGSVLLEAAACGLPIAATSAGGIVEVIEDGRTGLLSPPRRPDLLAHSLLRLLDDEALGRRLAAGAQERLTLFGLERMAAALEEVYAGLAFRGSYARRPAAVAALSPRRA
jgi:glycosyltransferase involved in cell wall biosynthesis